jgi:alanyl-tRNA synthetase
MKVHHVCDPACSYRTSSIRREGAFDFSYFAGVAEKELAEVENIMNDQVLKNTPVLTVGSQNSFQPPLIS